MRQLSGEVNGIRHLHDAGDAFVVDFQAVAIHVEARATMARIVRIVGLDGGGGEGQMRVSARRHGRCRHLPQAAGHGDG